MARIFPDLGTRRFETPLYSSDVAKLVEFTSFPGPSGSTVDTGLHTEDDFHPAIGALPTEAGFVDGDIATAIFTVSGSKWSVGLDQGKAQPTAMISIFDDGTAGAGIFWSGSAVFWGGSADSLDLYQSPDNYSWTYVRNYSPLYRAPYSGSSYVIHLACDADQRYLKLHASSGSLRSASGKYVQPTEIKTWQSNPPTTISGSIDNTIVVGPERIVKRAVTVSYVDPNITLRRLR